MYLLFQLHLVLHTYCIEHIDIDNENFNFLGVTFPSVFDNDSTVPAVDMDESGNMFIQFVSASDIAIKDNELFATVSIKKKKRIFESTTFRAVYASAANNNGYFNCESIAGGIKISSADLSIYTFDNVVYELSGNTATVIGYTGSATLLEIPAAVNGRTVTAIGEKAFLDCDTLEEILLPNTIKTIGERAFAWCEKLARPMIPQSVQNMGRDVFYLPGNE